MTNNTARRNLILTWLRIYFPAGILVVILFALPFIMVRAQEIYPTPVLAIYNLYFYTVLWVIVLCVTRWIQQRRY